MKPLFFIAEIGVNHNGDMSIVKKLIDVAALNNCDAVKFQKRTIDIVYSPEMLALYRESPWGTTTRQQKEGLEFGKEEYDEIDRYCKDKGIEWLASAWDIPSQLFLRQYNLKHNKIASAMATNLPFLKEVALEGKPTFLSTGMCTYDDIDRAIEILQSGGCEMTLMHTVSTYPAPEEDLNLAVIATLRERYGLPVGYSGHEAAASPAIMAAMLGATVIERHITLHPAMYGTDQAASLDPVRLYHLINMLRKIPTCVGSGVKCITPQEEKIAEKLRYWEGK